MKPTDYPIRRDTLKQFWFSFMKTGQVNPVDKQEPDPVILRSWQRCAPRSDPRQRPRLVTLQEQTLQANIKTHSQLMMMSRPFLEDIYQFLEGAYCAIVITDGAGCVLDTEGDIASVIKSSETTTTRGRWPQNQPLMIEELAAGLNQGTMWSEGHMGTNALGLALVSAMPVQVVGAEHYHEVYHQMASSAAPIHDANGRIVGIISIIEPVTSVTRHSLSLVMAAARAITNQLQAERYLQEANHRLSEVRTILEIIHEGVITWNANGNITHINALAGTLLRLTPASVLGRPYQDIITFPEKLQNAIGQHEELLDAEATLQANNATVECLASLLPIPYGDENLPGYIAVLRPIEHVRKLVHQQIGARALLTLEEMSVDSAAMRIVMRQARTAAKGTAPVLLRGEGGVGKNHLARAIHNDSDRGDQPFLALNCRAIPHELMIGEFLGYEQDANIPARPSKFELVNGGTIMFDQIESLSLEMQSALLHVIETGHVMRLGSLRPIPVDVRIIASTTEDLEKLVAGDHFLSHLYYRFGVFNLTVPPLRERTEDIALLAERFLARISQRDNLAVWIDDEATAVLKRYPWPGNVRELESILERALHHSQDNIIHVSDLPEVIRQGRLMVSSAPQAEPVLTAVEAEREAIIRAGWACHGQVSEMAQLLDISRTTLWRKMKHFELTPEQFKQNDVSL